MPNSDRAATSGVQVPPAFLVAVSAMFYSELTFWNGIIDLLVLFFRVLVTC